MKQRKFIFVVYTLLKPVGSCYYAALPVMYSSERLVRLD